MALVGIVDLAPAGVERLLSSSLGRFADLAHIAGTTCERVGDALSAPATVFDRDSSSTGLGPAVGVLDRSGRELDLSSSDVVLGVQLELLAVRALVQPQPREKSHPWSAFDAVEMVDGAITGLKNRHSQTISAKVALIICL